MKINPCFGLGLGIGLWLTTFAAAQEVNPEGFPIVDEPLTLSIMGAKSAIQGEWQTLRVFRVMEERSNISFTFDTPPGEAYEERKNLVFASGQLPDVFFGANLSAADEVTYGSQGLLIPLEDLIAEHAPNFSRLMEQDPSIRQAITTPDGHIYALPGIGAGYNLYPKIWINEPWLKAIGMEMPTTTDEFYNVLQAFKTEDPNGNGEADEIPLSATSSSWPLGDIRPGMLAAFGFSSLYESPMIDVKEGRVRFIPAEDNFRSYLEYMNRLHNEELLDPDSFAQDGQQLIAKGEADRLGVFSHAGPFLVVGPERNDDFPHLQPLTSELSPEPIWPQGSEVRRGAFAITRTNEHPEATMRWVDYFYSEEGAMLLSHGIEGEDWVNSEGGGFQRLIPDGENPEEWRASRITPDAGTQTPVYRSVIFERSLIGLENTHPQNYFIGAQTEAKLEPAASPGFPPTYFTVEEQNELNFILTDLESFVQQSEAAFIVGQRSLEEWEEYKATLEQIGAGRMTEIYQAAYDRYQATNAQQAGR